MSNTEKDKSYKSITLSESEKIEADFSNKKLSAEMVERLVNKFTCLKALDISRNKINIVPKCLPSSLIALDLSFNQLTNLSSINRVKHLVEIKLSNNCIQNISGLFSAVSLEYIDLSHNKIQIIEGTEMLSSLKSLLLRDNQIKFLVSIRALTFNKKLQVLDLSNNAVTSCLGYKSEVLQLLPNLEILDAKPLICHKSNKYKPNPKVSINVKPQTSSTEHSSKSFSPNNSKYHSIVDIGDELEKSVIPWRNPPKLTPRPCSWKGKEIIVGEKNAKKFHYSDVDLNYTMSHQKDQTRSRQSKKWSISESNLSSPQLYKEGNPKLNSATEYKPELMSLKSSDNYINHNILSDLFSVSSENQNYEYDRKNNYPSYDEAMDKKIKQIQPNKKVFTHGPPNVFKSVNKGISLFIKLVNGKNMVFDVEPTELIASLKRQIEDEEGILMDKQIIYWEGKILENHLSLSDYGIINDSVLYLDISPDSPFESSPSSVSDYNSISSKIKSRILKNLNSPGIENHLPIELSPIKQEEINDSIPNVLPVTPSGKALADAIKDLMNKKKKTLEVLLAARNINK